MARFEREAQVLASLNHPNIAAIYGIEQGAIVMELVEGSDLSGPVPIDTALAYARQIARGSRRPRKTISPTLSLAMTEAGMILGTAAYMAGAGARQAVDKRADIWAFGVVLYELLAGSGCSAAARPSPTPSPR